MVSKTWPPEKPGQKQNFYRSLSRLILDLASCPLDKIGSFTILDTGELCLGNRPLTRQLAQMEGQGIPTGISRDTVYSNAVLYFLDLLDALVSKFKCQPNATYSEDDARGQIACFTMMRTMLFEFTQKRDREGPFIMQFTDLNPGNIFIDEHYNITSIPDMEWCCALPTEKLCPPFWLGGHAIDEYDNTKAEEALRAEYDQFMQAFQQEDEDGSLTQLIRLSLERGVHWFMSCLNDPRATYAVYVQNVQTRFAPEHAMDVREQYEEIVAPYWIAGSSEFIKKKLIDYQGYMRELNIQLQK